MSERVGDMLGRSSFVRRPVTVHFVVLAFITLALAGAACSKTPGGGGETTGAAGASGGRGGSAAIAGAGGGSAGDTGATGTGGVPDSMGRGGTGNDSAGRGGAAGEGVGGFGGGAGQGDGGSGGAGSGAAGSGGGGIGGRGGGGGGGKAGGAGSSGGSPDAGTADAGGNCNLPSPVGFRRDVEPFLSSRCGGGNGCHVIDSASTASAGGYDHAYDWITAGAHSSSCPGTPTPKRFEIVLAVIAAANPPSCSRSRIMPPQNESSANLRKPLTACEAAALKAWVEEPLVTQKHRVDDTDPEGTPPFPMPPFN